MNLLTRAVCVAPVLLAGIDGGAGVAQVETELPPTVAGRVQEYVMPFVSTPLSSEAVRGR